MNGPTRSTAFDRHAPVGGDRRNPDMFDELDQFVDAEPAWIPARRPAEPPVEDAAAAPTLPLDEPDARHPAGAAGRSHEPDRFDDAGAFPTAAHRAGDMRAADRDVPAGRRGSAADRVAGGYDPDDGDGFAAFSRAHEPGADRAGEARPSAAPAVPEWQRSSRPADGGWDSADRPLGSGLSAGGWDAAAAEGGIAAGDPAGRADGGDAAALDPPRSLADADDADGRDARAWDAPAARAEEPAQAGPDGRARQAEPRSERRDAFAKRLSDELARPASPRQRTEPTFDAAAPPAPPAATAPERRAERRNAEVRPVPVAAAPARPPRPEPRTRDRAQAPDDVRPARRPYEEARDAARGDAEEALPVAADAPADALDFELDTAIGEIIASGRGGGREEEVRGLPPAPDAEASGAAPYRGGGRADGGLDHPVGNGGRGDDRASAEVRGKASRASGGRADPDAAPVQLPAVVQAALTKRQKPVPSFSYARRDDPPEPQSVAPRDVDDPFATVFFPDGRDAFEQPRSAEPLNLSLDLDGEDDGGFDDDGGADASDDLPPSLSRAAAPHRRRRAGWRSPGVLSLIAGAVVVLGLGLVGFGMLGDASSSGEVRIIHADARDVKVRNDGVAADADAPPPDISESVALGESDRLVVPGTVRLGSNTPSPDDGEGTSPRAVRTVIVRPDGSIVAPEADAPPPADAAQTEAAASPDEMAPAEPAPDGTAPDELAPDEIAATGLAGPADGVPVDEAPTPRVIDTSPDVGDGAAAGEDAIGNLIPDAPATDEAAGQGDTPAPEDPAAAEAPTARLETRLPLPRPSPPPRAARAPAGDGPAPAAAPEQLASVEPARPAPQAASREPWGVQVSSQRTEAEAEAAYRGLQRKYASILGGQDATIAPARVGGRGTFYRVKVGAGSRDEAAALCERLKAAGADCFIGRN